MKNYILTLFLLNVLLLPAGAAVTKVKVSAL